MAGASRWILGTANLVLIVAAIACGISFFGPFWLGNVDPRETVTANGTNYFLYEFPAPKFNDVMYVRGLWGQCGRKCQAFWENNYSLQKQLFTPLKWHLATQVLYFIGSALVLISLVFAQVQICCDERPCVFRTVGGILLLSFCVQTAAVAVFGGGAWKDYATKSSPILNVPDFNMDTSYYYNWCFWMAVAGGALTLLAGTLFLVYDCCLERRTHYKE
jgi:hypothetical protein